MNLKDVLIVEKQEKYKEVDNSINFITSSWAYLYKAHLQCFLK
mgnify:CR=1 FL=1